MVWLMVLEIGNIHLLLKCRGEGTPTYALKIYVLFTKYIARFSLVGMHYFTKYIDCSPVGRGTPTPTKIISEVRSLLP